MYSTLFVFAFHFILFQSISTLFYYVPFHSNFFPFYSNLLSSFLCYYTIFYSILKHSTLFYSNRYSILLYLFHSSHSYSTLLYSTLFYLAVLYIYIYIYPTSIISTLIYSIAFYTILFFLLLLLQSILLLYCAPLSSILAIDSSAHFSLPRFTLYLHTSSPFFRFENQTLLSDVILFIVGKP